VRAEAAPFNLDSAVGSMEKSDLKPFRHEVKPVLLPS
jgi:hypothetical protein